jgi:DNA-binding beta-propeller fold protein YncE
MVLVIVYSPFFYNTAFGQYKRVSEFNSNSMASGQSNGIAVDKDFNIYVTEPSQHRVEVFSQNGNYLKTLTLAEEGGTPVAVATHPSGDILVADAVNNVVWWFSGGTKSPLGLPFSLKGICGLDIDTDGSIYIRGADSIAVRHYLEGHFFSFSAPNSLSAMEPCPIAATNSGLVYYPFDYQVVKKAALGGTNATFISELPANDKSVFDITTDHLGNIFVVTAPWQIYKLDGNGKYIAQFNFEDEFFSNNNNGTFWYSYITTDSENNVYVLDSTNGKVLKFNEVANN